MPDKLTDKQTAFILEYFRDFNATQAAIRAGYSEDTAYSIGWENLRKPEIREAVDRHFADLGLTAERILAEQIAIGFSDAKDYIQVDEGGAAQAIAFDQLAPGKTKAIKKVKESRRIKENPDGSTFVDSQLEYELHDKQRALDVLAKHLSGRERITPPADFIPTDNSQSSIERTMAILDHAMTLAQKGQLDPQVVNNINRLASTLLKANEMSELEERIKSLELLLANKTEDRLDIEL